MDTTAKTLDRVILETSLKPYADDSPERVRAACREAFAQWLPLLRQAEKASLLLWTSDGSEILDYAGSLDDTFEWACWIGIANPVPNGKRHGDSFDSVFHFPKKFREDAKPRSYRWLKELLAIMRETCQELAGKDLSIGAIFDSGPEFAVSSFKYARHREICNGHTAYPNSFVTCDSLLKADSRRYAGFPNGIPEGLSLGRFLGRQASIFIKDLGFDYLWLSNGMGFGTEAWKYDGAIFDRKSFHLERIPETKARLLKFWREFREEFKAPIETRGSNFSAGVEMAGDAAPLKEIFEEARPARPVNSPWSAINRNPGLSQSAWMSHFASAPESMPFRFYVNDPWFAFAPWRDMYEKRSWDIDMPLSVSALDARGGIRTASSVSILAIDDCYGQLDGRSASEVQAALRNALDKRPDECGPLLWIYPSDGYARLTTGEKPNPAAVFAEDCFIGEAIQEGLPLNSVCDAGSFRSLALEKPELFKGRLLVIPVSAMEPEDVSALRTALAKSASGALLYGSTASACPELLELLGLELADGLDGECSIETSALKPDCAEHGSFAKSFVVRAQYCGGPLREKLAADSNAKALALASDDTGARRRVVALVRELEGGKRVAWTRAIVTGRTDLSVITPRPASEEFPAARLPRLLAQIFGFHLVCRQSSVDVMPPCLTISRKANAFVFSGLAFDASSSLEIALPPGAPLFAGSSVFVDGGTTRFNMPQSWRAECRFFVENATPGTFSCRRFESHAPGLLNRYEIKGLANAKLRFFPETGSLDRLKIQPHFTGDVFSRKLASFKVEETPFGPCIELDDLGDVANFVW